MSSNIQKYFDIKLKEGYINTEYITKLIYICLDNKFSSYNSEQVNFWTDVKPRDIFSIKSYDPYHLIKLRLINIYPDHIHVEKLYEDDSRIRKQVQFYNNWNITTTSSGLTFNYFPTTTGSFSYIPISYFPSIAINRSTIEDLCCPNKSTHIVREKRKKKKKWWIPKKGKPWYEHFPGSGKKKHFKNLAKIHSKVK